MSKKLRNTAAVFHAWAHQEFESAECGNVSYVGPRLYSYAACIAALLPNNVVAHTTRSWSITTTGHQSSARSASNHMRTVWCCNPEWTANQNRAKTEETVRSILRGIPEPVRRKDGVETVNSAKKRQEQFAQALRLTEQFNVYLAATGETNVEPLEITADMQSAVEELRLMDQKAKELAEQKAREAAERVKEHVQAWKRGEAVSNLVNLGAAPPALRLDKSGLRIETSWGAQIPTRDAERVWTLIKLVQPRGKDSPCTQEVKIGNYTLNTIYKDGSIQVGCHKIPYSELEEMAVVLGLKEKEND